MVAAQGGRWGGHLWNLFALPASSMLLRARVTFIFLSITFFLVGRLGFHLLPSCIYPLINDAPESVQILLEECRHHFNWWINQITGSQCEAQGMG